MFLASSRDELGNAHRKALTPIRNDVTPDVLIILIRVLSVVPADLFCHAFSVPQFRFFNRLHS
jgi:hypothetical protein